MIDLLFEDTLEAIETLLQHLQLRAVRQTDEVMTRTVKEVASVAWV
jgi:hypothetical protein